MSLWHVLVKSMYIELDCNHALHSAEHSPIIHTDNKKIAPHYIQENYNPLHTQHILPSHPTAAHSSPQHCQHCTRYFSYPADRSLKPKHSVHTLTSSASLSCYQGDAAYSTCLLKSFNLSVSSHFSYMSQLV